MFEGTYSPPRYLDMYNFKDGAQNDIFQDSYPGGIPQPGPNQTVVPTPFLGGSAQTPVAPPSAAASETSSVSRPASTVVQTTVVTVTASPVLVSSSVPTDSRATTTVFSTVVVTVSGSDAPSTTQSSRATVTVVDTAFATVTAGVPTESSEDVARNGTKGVFFAEFEDIGANDTGANDTSPLAPVPSSTSSSRKAVW